MASQIGIFVMPPPAITLVEYHKYWIYEGEGKKVNPDFDEKCRAILNIKGAEPKDYLRGVEYFLPLILAACEQLPAVQEGQTIQVAIVPKSKKGQVAPGLRKLATSLCEKSKKFEMPRNDILERTADVDKLANGGVRSRAVHLRTIKAIMPKERSLSPVLLLDDVTTTGNSLSACVQLIQQAGSSMVLPLALGRTM